MSERELLSSGRGKFWRRGGEDDFIEVRRMGDDEEDLSIEIEDGSDYVFVVISDAAESLLQWLDRSRGNALVRIEEGESL